MGRRKFTREFKLEAVRLIQERGVSYTQASRDLGVHQTVLRNWVKAFADDPVQAALEGQILLGPALFGAYPADVEPQLPANIHAQKRRCSGANV